MLLFMILGEVRGCKANEQHLLSLKEGFVSKNDKGTYSRCSRMRDYATSNATALSSIKLPSLSCLFPLPPSCVFVCVKPVALQFFPSLDC